MIEIKQDPLTDYWIAYVDKIERTKSKTLVKCLKSLTAYVKGQE